MRLNKNSNNSNNRSALAEPSDDDFEADENSNPSQNDTLSDKKSLNQIERTCPKFDKVFLTAAGKFKKLYKKYYRIRNFHFYQNLSLLLRALY